MQAWVDQNETFRFETTCNRYISPEYRRRHFQSLIGTGSHPGKALDSQLELRLTIRYHLRMRDHEGSKRSRLDSYNDDPELVI